MRAGSIDLGQERQRRRFGKKETAALLAASHCAITYDRRAFEITVPNYRAYQSQGHVPGDLIPIANTNHFTILDELRQPNSTLTRAVIAMAEYQTA